MPKRDDAVVKIISRLGVDYSAAIKASEQFAASLVTVNQQLLTLRQQVASLGRGITADLGQQLRGSQQILYDHLGRPLIKVGDQARQTAASVGAAAKKMKVSLQVELAQIEASLADTARKAQQLGFAIPGLPERQSQIKQLRDQLLLGEELTEEQQKQLVAAREFARVKAQDVKTLAAEAALRSELAKTGSLTAQSAAREAAAKTASLKQTASTLAVTEAQLATIQATISARGLEETTLASQTRALREQVQTLRKRFALTKDLTVEEMQQLNVLREEAALLAQNARTMAADAARRQRTLAATARAERAMAAEAARATAATAATRGRRPETFLERRFGWFVAGMGFFGAIQAGREAVRTIGEVEMGMTEIARVQEDVSFNFGQMRDQLMDLGVTYGMTWENVQDIALRWSQAGYNVADTIELTKTSLLALNTAELDAQYATQGLIAIMAQWGLEAEELLPVVDKINKVADDFAVTSQDLVDGLIRSGGAARAMGMTLEETIAVLTTMRESSGRTGREVGNALNSILAFMQRPIAIKAFEAEGIRIWADETRTQFRNVMEIFAEVAKKWPQLSQATQDMFVQAAESADLYSEEIAELAGAEEEWTQLQQRNLSQAMAGIYRRNYLSALLKNWAQTDEVLISMEEALGYSLAENERTMQTYQKMVEQLRVSLEKIAVAMGEAGLLDLLKNLASLVTNTAETVNRLEPGLRALLMTFIRIASVAGVIQLVGRTFFDVSIFKAATSAQAVGAKAVAQAMKEAAEGAAEATVRLTAMQRATTWLKGSFSGLAGAIRANLPLLALTVTATTILSVANAARANARAMAEQGKRAGDLADRIENLSSRYRELATKSDRTQAEEEALRSVTKELVEIVPSAITGFDAMGRAITDVGTVAAETTKKIATLRDEHQKFLESQASVARSRVPELKAEIAERRRQFELLTQAMQQGVDATRSALVELSNEAFSFQEALLMPWIMADESRMMVFAEERLNILRGMMQESREELTKYEAALRAVVEWQQRLILESLTPESLMLEKLQTRRQRAAAGGGRGEGAEPLSVEQARQFVEEVLNATAAVTRYGAAVQRDLDLTRVRLDFYGRESAAIAEQIPLLSERLKWIDLLVERQRTLQAEAGKVRESIAQLVEKREVTTDKEALQVLTEAIERQKDRLNELSRAWWQQQLVLADGLTDAERDTELRRQRVELLEKEIDFLTREGATQTELATAETKRLEVSQLYRQEQAALNRQIEEWNAVITEATKRQRDLDTTTEVGRRQYEYLNQTISDANAAILKLKASVLDLTQKQEQLNASTQTFEDVLDRMQALAQVGLITTRQMLDVYRSLQESGSLTFRQLIDMAKTYGDNLEDRVSLALGELENRIRRVNDALNDLNEEQRRRREEIRKTLEQELSALQAQLDALEAQETADERERLTKEHNERLKRLQDDRLWYVLQGEEKHAFEIAALDKQIAAENRKWAEQLKRWNLEDQREKIQTEMDAARERAALQEESLEAEIERRRQALEAERDLLQTYYDSVKDLMTEGFLKALSAIMTLEPAFRETGERLTQALIEGLMRDPARLPDIIARIRSQVETQRGRTGQDLLLLTRSRQLLAAKRAWEAAYRAGDREGMAAAAARGAAIRAAAGGAILDPSNTMTADQLEQAIKKLRGYQHGGLILGPTVGYLGEAGQEVVLPLKAAVPVLADALLGALRQLQVQAAVQPLDISGLARVFERALTGFGQRMPSRIEIVMQIDGETVGRKAVAYLTKEMRQPIRQGG